MPLLEVRGLVKHYRRRRVVDRVDFDVDTREIVGLLGPNGAGKTTSFRMTIGLITPDAGQVTFDRMDVTRWPMYQRARHGMGYLAQETSIFRKLTLEQNLLAILETQPIPRAERYRIAHELLDQFGLLHLRRNIALTLSGGEKRRLEIARALITRPSLILLDEPFTGIDPKTIADIQDIIRQLRDQGIAVLLTDHNVRETLAITDRSYLIRDGQVFKHGRPADLVVDPEARRFYFGERFEAGSLAPAKSG